jgi:asparagine synthase (glutamine-hydrolysing)
MCGIAGIVKFDSHASVGDARLKRMREVLSHRGPDDAGMVIRGNAGLAHRRLSIIDVAGGHQPMGNANGTVWITYNGEVYNFRELRAELESRGCSFRTRCDTEVVLRAYEVFGEACVERLRGMFAFAVWDTVRRKLLLARDRLGIKPLYYAQRDDELLFGSEIKSILAAERLRPSFNRAILPEFLGSGFVAGTETFFRGIRKLLPGRTLTWSPDEGLRERQYWRPPVASGDRDATLEQHAEALRSRLEAAVRSHLVSDVPLGLFLSGGIDSSALAALMAPMRKEPIRTFAVGFAERDANELAYARLAAAAAGAEHREVVVSPEEFFDALPRLLWHEDEPIAFPSSVPLYFVSRLAREHVKVVLTGEGADELFLGYNRYRVTAWNERLAEIYHATCPARVRSGARRLVRALPRRLRRYAQRTFLAHPADARDLFYENFAVFPEEIQIDLLGDPALLAARDPYAEGLRCYRRSGAGSLERMSHADLQTYLVELLMKQDQMSMAASLESRVPFLDHEFVEHAMGIPARFKLRGWQTKAVLRAALRDLVPKPILTRPKKGFPVPVGAWLRRRFWPVVEEFVLGPRALERGLFDPRFLRQLAEEHRAAVAEHGDRLWLLLNLEIWQRIFIDGEHPAEVSREPHPSTQLAAAA